MKKGILIGLLAIASITANAQKCKYKVNEVDKFTGKYTKLTKSEKVMSTFYTVGEFSIKKVGEDYFFIFDYLLSSYSRFDPYSIEPNAKLIFLLEDGSKLELTTPDKIQGTNKTIIGLPPVYICTLKNISYPVTKEQINLLFNSPVKTIRFYRTESNGKEDYTDTDIKKRNQDDIIDLIKCVL